MDKKILTLKDLKSSDYLSVDFYLSKSCNKSCHYCTAWTLEMRNLHVDMDFLRRTVEYLSPYKTRICLLGGEPGLIKNLDEVIAEIKKHPNLVVQVMSNSFVRKRYPQVLEDPEIIYIEHLVLDFYEDRIEKLGNFDFLPENDKNNYNLIIETPGYFKYKDQHDLSYIMHKNTEFKEYNSRSPDYHSDHFVEHIHTIYVELLEFVTIVGGMSRKIHLLASNTAVLGSFAVSTFVFGEIRAASNTTFV